MDFSFSKKQLVLHNKAIKFAEENLNQDLIESDKNSKFPQQSWEKCAKFGIQGLFVPKEYGGQELDYITATLVLEGLGYGCKDNGLLFSLNAHVLGCLIPILKHGNKLQKEKFLPGLCEGKLIGAHAMVEPGTGSDVLNVKTVVKTMNNKYVINGVKTFITNGSVADVFLVFAKIKNGKDKLSYFIVEKNSPGLIISKNIEKMGLRTAPFTKLIFQNCKISKNNLLGQEGLGQVILHDTMAKERALILAPQIGAMQRELEECVSYSKKRTLFKKKIFDFQSISNMLADMKVRLETSRLLIYKVAWLKQNNKSAILESSIAKYYVSEACVKNSLSSLRILGGYGYSTEYEIERRLRDSIGGLIYSGTSEIQRNIIAKLLD